MSNEPQRGKGILYVISAPSGAGKTSICKEILQKFPGLHRSISYTTRSRREGEQDGVDYHFISADDFQEMVNKGSFVEWAQVHGNFYGTAKETIQKALSEGSDILLDVDFQGAEQLRQSGLDGIFIFILPPNMKELRKRLDFRNTDADPVIEQRMDNASEEIAQAVYFDYLVVNDVLDKAVDSVRSIIKAEAVRTARMIDQLPEEFGLKSI